MHTLLEGTNRSTAHVTKIKRRINSTEKYKDRLARALGASNIVKIRNDVW